MNFSFRPTQLLIIAAGCILQSTTQAKAVSHDGDTAAFSEERNNALGRLIDPWPPATASNPSIRDLSLEYSNIFRHGNRNAASHLWSTFLLERAPQMRMERLQFFFSGFCAVSGSQVRPSDYNRYRLTLPLVSRIESNLKDDDNDNDDGMQERPQKVTGFVHYCCWPCVCDTQDYIHIDTLNVTSQDGITRRHYFAVIGNPCDHPERLEEPFIQPFSYAKKTTTLSKAAPELVCLEGGTLKGATLSDHGYIIIGYFSNAMPASSSLIVDDEENALEPWSAASQVPGRISAMDFAIQMNTGGSEVSVDTNNFRSVQYQDERDWEHQCIDRAFNGYNSGMGEVFRRVAAISPIVDCSVGKDDPRNIDPELLMQEDQQEQALSKVTKQQPSTEDPSCDVPIEEISH